MAFEHRKEPLLPGRRFAHRLVRHALGALTLCAATLGLGMAGYHTLEGLSWVDAYLNATMILGGMGPVTEMHTTAGKIFAGTYALFAGLMLVVIIGVALAPVLHRALHVFHLDEHD